MSVELDLTSFQVIERVAGAIKCVQKIEIRIPKIDLKNKKDLKC